jgi:hypothetical protein
MLPPGYRHSHESVDNSNPGLLPERLDLPTSIAFSITRGLHLSRYSGTVPTANPAPCQRTTVSLSPLVPSPINHRCS